MQRYFVEENQIKDRLVSIQGNDLHHIKNVMRFKVGQVLTVVTYSGKSYLTSIDSFTKNGVMLKIINNLETKDNILNITLAQALIKRDKFELVLQKTTELGIKEIIPIKTKNSIIKIDNFAKKKIRYQTIVKEASEQSERDIVPKIGELTNLEDLDLTKYDYVLTAYARNESQSLFSEIKKINRSMNVLVLIGPEGGFTKTEIEYLKTRSKLISLGDTILRSETAAIYIVSAFRFIWEK